MVCVFLARKKGAVRKNIEQRRSCGFERSKFMKRILGSVLYFFETDHEFRF